jgi:hypothetical protein
VRRCEHRIALAGKERAGVGHPGRLVEDLAPAGERGQAHRQYAIEETTGVQCVHLGRVGSTVRRPTEKKE